MKIERRDKKKVDINSMYIERWYSENDEHIYGRTRVFRQ